MKAPPMPFTIAMASVEVIEHVPETTVFVRLIKNIADLLLRSHVFLFPKYMSM